jgi:hypothetical protein
MRPGRLYSLAASRRRSAINSSERLTPSGTYLRTSSCARWIRFAAVDIRTSPFSAQRMTSWPRLSPTASRIEAGITIRPFSLRRRRTACGFEGGVICIAIMTKTGIARQRDSRRNGIDALRRLRGLLKEELAEYGGGRAFLKWLRCDRREPRRRSENPEA